MHRTCARQHQSDRTASGDPRLSIEERYGSLSTYYWLTLYAMQDLVAKRLILADDASAVFVARLQAVLAGNLLPTKKGDMELVKRASTIKF